MPTYYMLKLKNRTLDREHFDSKRTAQWAKRDYINGAKMEGNTKAVRKYKKIRIVKKRSD